MSVLLPRIGSAMAKRSVYAVKRFESTTSKFVLIDVGRDKSGRREVVSRG